MNEFKDIFTNLRKEKGYTQRELADKLNISKSTIAMWETGKRTPERDMYENIADYFNVDLDFLYGRSDVKRKITFDEDGNQYNYVPEFDCDHIELIDLYSKLSQEQKKTVMDMLRSFTLGK